MACNDRRANSVTCRSQDFDPEPDESLLQSVMDKLQARLLPYPLISNQMRMFNNAVTGNRDTITRPVTLSYSTWVAVYRIWSSSVSLSIRFCTCADSEISRHHGPNEARSIFRTVNSYRDCCGHAGVLTRYLTNKWRKLAVGFELRGSPIPIGVTRLAV